MHEPKGVASATAGQVYAADGAGSGVWETLVIPTGLFRITFATFTASGTWTKPSGLFKARIHVQASGSSTVANGGNASFGTWATANGGVSSSGAGGTASNGDVNITGSSSTATGMPGLGGGIFNTKGIGVDNIGTGVGGGGGGYSMREIPTASLGATETVTIGTTGQNNGFVLVEQYITV